MDEVDLNIVELVRERCAAVADGATLVRIDPDAVAPFAARLASEGHGRTEAAADPWLASDGTVEQRAALVLALDAVNFGSGYHPVVTKRPGCSGAVTMATALREHL